MKSILFFVMKFLSSKFKQKNFDSEIKVNLGKKINEDIKTGTTQPNLPFKKVETNIDIKN